MGARCSTARADFRPEGRGTRLPWKREVPANVRAISPHTTRVKRHANGIVLTPQRTQDGPSVEELTQRLRQHGVGRGKGGGRGRGRAGGGNGSEADLMDVEVGGEAGEQGGAQRRKTHRTRF